MTAHAYDLHRMAVVEAAKSLTRDATEAAGASDPHSPAWRFYHGVEAAAAEVLRPEIAVVHQGTAWLQREDPAFREGFSQASLLLGTAATLPEPPLRLPLPRPPETSHRS